MSAEGESLYEVLALPPSATEDEIRRAISQHSTQWSKRAAMAASVEKRHEAERVVRTIGEARRVLLDPDRRREYDQGLVEVPDAPPETAGAAASEEGHGRVPCPYCMEPIFEGAKKCRWCNEWLGEGGEAAAGAGRSPSGPLVGRPAMPEPAAAAAAALEREAKVVPAATPPPDAGGPAVTPAASAVTFQQVDDRLSTIGAAAAGTPMRPLDEPSPMMAVVGGHHDEPCAASIIHSIAGRPLAAMLDLFIVLTPMMVFVGDKNGPALFVCAYPLYLTIGEGPLGGTIGQRMARLRVVTTEGQRIGVIRSAFRLSLGAAGLGLTWGLSYLPVLFTPRHRALHDLLTGTYFAHR